MTEQIAITANTPDARPGDDTEQPAPPAAAPEPARRAIAELADGDRVDTVFAVRDRELSTTRNDKEYLRLKLGDASGIVPAICWDDAARCFEVATKGAIIRVQGRYTVSERYGPQVKIERLASVAEGSYETADLQAVTDVPLERLEADMRQLIETIQSRDLRTLLDGFFGEQTPSWKRFREAPAAKIYHQAYTGGLLEHTLSVAQGVSAAAAFFPGIDRDIAITGALLHDIGKTEAYNDDPMAIDLTTAGRLEGEIPLGYYKVRRAIEDIEGFDPATAQHLFHIILSHHGSLEHGSPVVPATREATLVHMLDNLGGTLGSFDRLERELPEGEAWSRFDRGISGSAYFAKRVA